LDLDSDPVPRFHCVSECWYCCKHEFYAITSFVGLVMMQTTMNLLCKHVL
jgi:hypothetical protein